MSCIFAHTRAHIISAPLAKYVIGNKSRFRFSHEFQHVPIETINRLFNDESFFVQVRQTMKKSFFVSKAFDYLFRPIQLAHLSIYGFFTHYESVALTKSKTKTNNTRPILRLLLNIRIINRGDYASTSILLF